MKTNYCSNCGTKISEGSKFCRNCGTPIDESNYDKKTGQKQFQKREYQVTSSQKSAKPFSNKKSGFLQIVAKAILGIIIFIIIGTIILYNLGDDSNNTLINNATTSNTAIIQEPKSLKKAANKMETIFKKADTTQLKLLLSDTSFKTYKGVYVEIAPYMSEYAKAFKTRKLIKLNNILAQYSFEDEEGNKYTVEFASTSDNDWKLIRF